MVEKLKYIEVVDFKIKLYIYLYSINIYEISD